MYVHLQVVSSVSLINGRYWFMLPCLFLSTPSFSPVTGSIVSFSATAQCLSPGSTVLLRCIVYGYPIPTAIFTAYNTLIVSNGHTSLVNNTLAIQNAISSDATTYSCQILPSLANVSLQLPLCGKRPPWETWAVGIRYRCSPSPPLLSLFPLPSPVSSPQDLIIGISVGGSAALALLLLVVAVVIASVCHIARERGTDLVPLIQVFVSPLTSSDGHQREGSAV